MNRKLVGLAVVVVAVLGVVWFAFMRDRGGAKPPQVAGSGRTGSAEVQKPPPEPAKPDEPARGGTPRFVLDVDPEGRLTLAGQVLGPDGKGVGGAEVWLGSRPPRSTKAEDDGSFSFDKLVGRTYELSARAGELVGEARYKLVDKGDPVVIHVAAGASLVVTVTDDKQQPVSGAEVKLAELGPRTQKTDAKGEATLAPVQPGWVAVQATATGFAPATGTASIGSAGATGRLALRLRKGFSVSGRVIDEGGKPIAKARISAQGSWSGPDDDATGAVSTDAKGKFTIAALPAGTHMLSALDEVHAPATSAPFVLTDKPVTDLEITMKEGGVIAGMVLDTAQKPVPFATLRVVGQGEQLWSVMARQATTDETGAFQLRGLTRTKLQIRAESDAAASKLVPVDLTEQVAKRDLKLVLDGAGSIAGVVVDEKGAPVPEVSVNVFPDFMKGASLDIAAIGAMSSAMSDGAGAFSINGLPDGPYKVWASRASSGREWGQHGIAAKTGDKNVRLVLAAPGGIKGKIAIQGADQPPKVTMVRAGSRAATPAYDGVFELKDVAAGKWDVSFTSTEFATFVQPDVVIESGKTTDVGTITVHRGRKLVGKVVDSAGAPIAGARVRVAFFVASTDDSAFDEGESDSNNGVRSAISDRDGGFSIIGIPAQATTAVAEHATRGRSAAVSIPAGADDPQPVQLALVGFGSITGKVTMKGKPVPKTGISASTKGGGAQASFAQTDDNGNFKLAKVPEGTVSVQVIRGEAMSMKTHAVSLQVVAGQETKAAIDIPVGQITVTVEPRAQASHKVDAAQVFVFDGTVVIANAKQLIDGMFSGGGQANKSWLGTGTPYPAFAELLPGDKSICTIPITGNLGDPTFQARMGQHMASMKVYCKAVKVPATPLAQTIVHEVPSMTPLPN